jgi:hypothetical protein
MICQLGYPNQSGTRQRLRAESRRDPSPAHVDVDRPCDCPRPLPDLAAMEEGPLHRPAQDGGALAPHGLRLLLAVDLEAWARPASDFPGAILEIIGLSFSFAGGLFEADGVIYAIDTDFGTGSLGRLRVQPDSGAGHCTAHDARARRPGCAAKANRLARLERAYVCLARRFGGGPGMARG